MGKARRQGISLNKAIKQLLAESLGLAQSNSSHAGDFADLSGVWSAEDIQEFNNTTQELSDINLSDWK